MNLEKELKGSVKISVCGLNTERFINICHNNNILLNNVITTDSGCILEISVSDFRKIKRPAHICRVRIRIMQRDGLPFVIHKYRKRYFFIYGIMIFILVNIVMSGYLWRIRITGNMYYSSKEIIDYINSMDIHYGMKTGRIACDDIEAGLRQNFERITWVSADVNGSRLRINIKEENGGRTDDNDTSESDICAAEDGCIVSIITRSGTPIVKAGDEVKKGDVLVMSKVESFNESGECFGVRYVRADADIITETSINYSDGVLREHKLKEYTGRMHTGTGIKIGNRLINYNISKCKYDNYDVYTEYKEISPYENMNLPITYAYFYYKEYNITTSEYTDEELEAILNANLANYIEKIQENGIQIIQNSVKIDIGSEAGQASGTLLIRTPATVHTAPVINPATEESEGTSNE